MINGLYNGVTTVELDNLAAETAATMTTDHPDYAVLAARIAVSNLHKETKKQFSGKFPAISLCGMLLILCVLFFSRGHDRFVQLQTEILQRTYSYDR